MELLWERRSNTGATLVKPLPLISYLDRAPAVVALLARLCDNVDATVDVSTVTALALYSYPDLNDEEEAAIKRLLTDMFVVPLDSRLARYAGYLRRLYRLKTPDSAIAATAMLTKTTLLTRNVDDCRQLDGLKLQEM
jgi:predicted nucleic acid-binding protein